MSDQPQNERTGELIILPCSKCKTEKLIDQFKKRSNRPETGKRLGRNSACIDCQRELYRDTKNKRIRKYKNRQRKYNLEEMRIKERRQNLKKYGMTLEDFDKLMIIQNGACAICQSIAKENKRLHVDHCHQTGKIRGLLCSLCNTSLGGFRDDQSILLSAINYLNQQDLSII